jgi:hypothetical protein
MAKASEQMEKALKVSECVPESGTELHRERLLSKLLDEAVVDGDPQTILLFKGLVRAAGEEYDGEVGTLGECAHQLRQHSAAPERLRPSYLQGGQAGPRRSSGRLRRLLEM